MAGRGANVQPVACEASLIVGQLRPDCRHTACDERSWRRRYVETILFAHVSNLFSNDSLIFFGEAGLDPQGFKSKKAIAEGG